ncbi:hypothetical protein [uncultured Desulfuromusa sp.]|uniref:hypothetical protein n=1 Tax=uncultured Desulfuromusa sp. TaxID=219183 RepID=UPI002AA750FA|nr:hypothetical protein [uncultured Desulfuromusa sp.]
MKFKEILTTLKPFASVAASFVPGGSAAIELVNAFLPEDKKLPETATGGDVISAVDSLPAEQRASLFEKQIDLEIAQEEGWTDRYKAMCAADGQSTRPKIAYMMAQVLCFEILAFTVWCFIYPEQMRNPVLWTVFGTLTGVPAGVLTKYFGDLKKEQQNRLGSSNKGPIAGILAKFGMG